jgi:phosphatidylglycerophosphatase A
MAALNFCRIIASGFGCGYFPYAPGTAASLAAVVVGAGLLWASAFALPVAVLVAAFVGLWAIGAAGGGDDPHWVVIDEFAGQWIALLPLTRPTFAGLAAAFLLFRFLDIVKPGPVAWADRQHGAAAVMADDLVAGAIAGGILWAVQSRWPGVLN